uniref:Translocation protein SEC62 n=1 Tax=Strongyloides stercoralis TaxID=6248 RepID=A0A0K0EDQ8_STRER
MGRKFRKEDDSGSKDEDYNLTKEEEDIAYTLRYDSGYKNVNFNDDDVAYTRGDKMIECLLNSPKYGTSSEVPLFKKEYDAIDYCQTFMDKELFVRVDKRVYRKRDTSDSSQLKKTPKKIKFFYSNLRNFDGTSEAYYLWNYNPTPFYKKIIGAFMMLGAIGLCLMPLWPEWLKSICYYIGVAISSLCGSLIGLYLLQQLLFFSLLFISLGKLRFTILPNLVAECSFLESFVPLYTCEWSTKKCKKN